ncbi:MAG: ribbon-helix-helix domain-containing protein [Enterobacteriaceae bacterium]|jgi:predicted transcriptional regulator|nr:ribbon-helix-helix domain-containing protein [Enterobacteriaceae bacterium]
MAIMSVRLNDEISTQLDSLAKSLGLTQSALARKAIEDYLTREAWQIIEPEENKKEENKTRAASAEEMQRMIHAALCTVGHKK